MKKKYILSGLVGGSFFGASYLLLSLNLPLALFTSIAAFGASTLLFKENSEIKELGIENENAYKRLLESSKNDLNKLKEMQIEDEKINTNVLNIIKTTEKIIKVLSKKTNKISSASKFLNYYLPITIKILERFDEIEEQKLTSKSSKEFVDRIRNLIVNIEIAFENQLNNLYSDDLIDINAEIKVFETMLKADGLIETSIKGGEKDE